MALAWIDLDQDCVTCIAFADQRCDGRISSISSIPIRLTIDFDCSNIVRRQADASRKDQPVISLFRKMRPRSVRTLVAVIKSNGELDW